MHTFHAYSRASIGLLASLCGPWVLISMAPTHIDHHASYHSPLHPLRDENTKSNKFQVYWILAAPLSAIMLFWGGFGEERIIRTHHKCSNSV